MAWLALVFWLTLRSAPAQAATVAELRWYCISCGAEGVADLLLNVLLFAPLGIAACGLGWSWRKTAVVFFALSTSIEITQATLLVGRDASLGDVLANSTGAILGWLVLPLLIDLCHPAPRTARRAAIVVTSLMFGTWAASGIGLRPALDGTSRWVGQLLPSSPFTEPFAGAAGRVTVNGVAITNGPFEPPRALADSLALTVQLTRDDTRAPRHSAVIARIKDDDGNLEVHVSQVGEALVLEARVAGSHWLLHTPQWRFDRALVIPLHTAWRYAWRWEPGALVFSSGPADGSQPAVATRRKMSVASGWVFIHPFVSVVGQSQSFWTALWLAAWFGMLGWLAGWVAARERWLIGAAALGGFVLIGGAVALPPSGIELLAAAASYLLLAVLPRRVAAS